jgi:cell division protein FtsA
MGETIKLRTAGEMPAYRNGLLAVLDVGSSKSVCLIGRGENGLMRVVGSALRESQGIRAGTVIAMDQAEESIRDAVDAAENLADTRIQNVIISVNCGAPVSVTSRAAMALEGEIVTDAHLRALVNEGRVRCQLEGHDLIQSAPTTYVVDEARGVRQPLGMFAQRLGVAMHGVAVKPSPLANLKLAVERCHLHVVGTQFAAYAAGLATLTDDEKQLGATVIDMGGGTTSIAVFMEGHLAHADVVPMGGQQVTADLARMLAAPLAAAERAKTLYGAAMGDMEANADVIPLAQMGEEGEDSAMRVPRSMLTRIIQARLEEIFGQVQSRLRQSGFDVAAGRRAVLTGGACQLAGTRELAGRILNKQVRIGRPHAFPGLPSALSGPDSATAVGLLMAGATLPPEVLNPELALETRDNKGKGWFARLTGGLFE